MQQILMTTKEVRPMDLFKAWVLSVLAVIAVTALCCWLTGNTDDVPCVLPVIVFLYIPFSLLFLIFFL